VTVAAATPEETMALGAEVASRFLPGDVVLLEGPLGAGKTTFVRGALAALGWHGPVRSPTFNLVSEYATRPPALHVDLYRLAGPEDLGIGVQMADSVTFVEWPERDPELATGHRAWHVSIRFEGDGREVSVIGPSL
jgi:tRNA threonylcarbamoyladenosine biosynthesis protein TsaE